MISAINNTVIHLKFKIHCILVLYPLLTHISFVFYKTYFLANINYTDITYCFNFVFSSLTNKTHYSERIKFCMNIYLNNKIIAHCFHKNNI